MPKEWSDKRERQYEHIKDSYEERGVGEDEAEERAARTVNKERAQSGESRESSRTSTEDISPGRRGGLRSHKGSGGRTAAGVRWRGQLAALGQDRAGVVLRCGRRVDARAGASDPGRKLRHPEREDAGGDAGPPFPACDRHGAGPATEATTDRLSSCAALIPVVHRVSFHAGHPRAACRHLPGVPP